MDTLLGFVSVAEAVSYYEDIGAKVTVESDPGARDAELELGWGSGVGCETIYLDWRDSEGAYFPREG